MERFETPIFVKQVQAALSDEEYRAFQLHLILRPDAGPVIRARLGFGKCDGNSQAAENVAARA